MIQSPEVAALRAFFTRASRRLTWLAAIRGAAVGLAVALDVALAIALVRWSGASSSGTIVVGLWLAAIGLTIGIAVAILRRRNAPPVALDVERRAPECRNVVVTAAELIDEPARVHPYVGEMVFREAAAKVGKLDPAFLFPARRGLTTLGAISAIWVVAVAVVAAHDPATARWPGTSPSSSRGPIIAGVDVVVTPPEYAGKPAQTFHDPSRIDALAGSRIQLTVRADAGGVSIETLNGRQALVGTGDSRYSGTVTADADGFIAIEPSGSGQVGVRRLIGISVTPDHPPRVKITAPGKDMFLSDAKRTIDITIEADDDLALASLKLRYTKVSGSGERFTFIEGEVPVTITRADDRTWKARGALKLDVLALTRGDMAVYRGVATDKRPGATPTESDAFLIEITSLGMIAAEGFSLDDTQDKYALSQQMVILKTERLLARSSGLSPESLTYHSQVIAAEQRAVRAEFVFMMGGEVAEEVIAAAGLTDINEEAEAANEADLGAGRMVNRGRVALIQSIRRMSRASTLLNAADPRKALPEEKAALVSLQQAFSRTRYLLRALTQRERLDLSRRLTGVLEAASRDVRPATHPATDPRVSSLRRALAGIAALAGGGRFASNAAATASVLAQTVLEVDPSTESLQRVAAELNEAGAAISRDNADDARRLLDGAATRLAAVLRAGLLTAPSDPRSAEWNRLKGELADALRRTRGGR